MIRIKNPVLRQMFEQLRFASAAQKKKYFLEAEKLMLVLEPQRDYPYDFVVYRITGFRPQSADYEGLVSGSEIADDLRVWLTQLSREVQEPAAQESELIFTIADLCKRFGVSDKTIRRWQKRGLAGRIYLFDKGKKKIGFAASSVERFAGSNPELVRQASAFRQADEQEKKDIIDAYQRLGRDNPQLSRHQILLRLAAQFGRARETIRCLIGEYELDHPEAHFAVRAVRHLGSQDAAAIYHAWRQGTKPRHLMAHYGKSRGTILRIITGQWSRELNAKKIDFVPSPDFEAQDAQPGFLSAQTPQSRDDEAGKGRPLSRSQEQELFSRYNYLKYTASRLRAAAKPHRLQLRRLRQIEETLLRAEKVKQQIIEANVPLVASIAGKHLTAGVSMEELISEGTMSLMRAVEKFDYIKGYRFSTYATWAVAKDFARGAAEQGRMAEHAAATDIAHISVEARTTADPGDVEKARTDLRRIIEDNLDSRERYVVLNHFALDAGVIKKKPKTLMQIGQDLGLTKERIRQIELQALQKLRHSLSPEQFDLLTG